TQHKNVSDATARKIDEVVRSILDKAYGRTRELLTANLDKLHAMSELLLQYETIDAPQIDAIMEGRAPPPPAGWGRSGKGRGAARRRRPEAWSARCLTRNATRPGRKRPGRRISSAIRGATWPVAPSAVPRPC